MYGESLLYAALAPFVLALIGAFWHYPVVLEELIKIGIISINRENKSDWVGLGVGLVFGLSETVIYTLNAWMGWQWVSIGQRLVTTVPMHALTGLVIGRGYKTNHAWLYWLAALGMHLMFNRLNK